MPDERSNPQTETAQQQPPPVPSRRWLFAAFWLLLLGGLYWWIDGWYGRMLNPNTAAALSVQRGELSLRQGLGGNYKAEGELNGERVTFLVDTGADSVALSIRLAAKLGLKRGAAVTVGTASGRGRPRVDRA